jgi:hypothetical protein
MDTTALVPDELRQQIPALRSQEGKVDPMVYTLLHRPGEYLAWLLTELQADLAFGWIIDHNDGEFGSFALSALLLDLPTIIQYGNDGDHRAISDGPQGEQVRRDVDFTPRPLQEARTYYEALWEKGAKSYDGTEEPE